MTIYTFIYCSKADCNANDSFSIKIKETDQNEYREIFRIGTVDRIRDYRWNNETIYFSTISSEIFVIKYAKIQKFYIHVF